MLYLTSDDYIGKLKDFPFPNDNIDPKRKREKDYFLAYCNALMADYTNNRCEVNYNLNKGKRSFKELRDYATGQQPLDKLKQVLGRKNNKGVYVSKMNVSFDTYFKLPQLFDIMRAQNMSREYDMEVHCIDENSVAAREAEREALKFMLDDETVRFMQRMEFKQATGANPEDMGLYSAADVDLWFDIGGYTLQREIALNAAAKKSKMESNYLVFQDALFDMGIVNPQGLCGARVYIDESTKMPKFRPLDVERCIIPFSKYNDFHDITRAAEIRVMTIADIKEVNPDMNAYELKKIAKHYQWLNPDMKAVLEAQDYYVSRWNGADPMYGIDPISNCKVLVLDAQWLSADIEHFFCNETKSGKKVYKRVDFDYELDKNAKRDGAKKIGKNFIKKYEAQWVIGTDCFINFGVCKDVVYYGTKGNKTPKLDFFFGKTGNASLVERAISIVDDIDLSIIKQRNMIATIPAAPAMVIQKDLLENVFLNGIKQQPEDIIRTGIELGVFYVNGVDDHGKPIYVNGAGKPFEFLNISEIFNGIAAMSNHILGKLNELREVLGLQNGADGGNVSPYQGLGQTEIAQQNANASLRPTFRAVEYVLTNVFEDVLRKWQVVAKDNDLSVTYSPLSNKNLQIIKLGGDFSNSDFNLQIRVSPSKEELSVLLNDIKQLKALGTQTDGAQGLTASEYMYVWEKVMAGNLKEAMFVLARIEARKKALKIATDRENMQATIQGQQQSAMLTAEENRKTVELEGALTNDKTLITKLFEQNTMLLGKMFDKLKEGETFPNRAEAEAIVMGNNQAISDVVNPVEETPMMPQDEMMMQEQPPMEMQDLDNSQQII